MVSKVPEGSVQSYIFFKYSATLSISLTVAFLRTCRFRKIIWCASFSFWPVIFEILLPFAVCVRISRFLVHLTIVLDNCINDEMQYIKELL